MVSRSQHKVETLQMEMSLINVGMFIATCFN